MPYGYIGSRTLNHKNLVKRKSSIQLILSIIALISIRFFESRLFYDPFNSYFKGDFQELPIPKLETVHFYTSLSFRYLLNLGITLIIIWNLFKEKNYLKATAWVSLIFFICLIGAFIVFSHLEYPWVKMILFYIRRFLIHPILLLVLVPAFYFLERTTTN